MSHFSPLGSTNSVTIFLKARIINFVNVMLFSSDKFWYCRLSPNHKVLHYGDLEESPQGEVPHDSLQDKCKWFHTWYRTPEF